MTLLPSSFNQAIKIGSQFPLVVGNQKAGSLSRGKTLPAGFVQGKRSSLGQLGKFADQRRGGDISEAGLLHVQRTSGA